MEGELQRRIAVTALPEPLRDWLEAQIKRGRYGNASEYLRGLIRRDQEPKPKSDWRSSSLRASKAGRSLS